MKPNLSKFKASTAVFWYTRCKCCDSVLEIQVGEKSVCDCRRCVLHAQMAFEKDRILLRRSWAIFYYKDVKDMSGRCEACGVNYAEDAVKNGAVFECTGCGNAINVKIAYPCSSMTILEEQQIPGPLYLEKARYAEMKSKSRMLEAERDEAYIMRDKMQRALDDRLQSILEGYREGLQVIFHAYSKWRKKLPDNMTEVKLFLKRLEVFFEERGIYPENPEEDYEREVDVSQKRNLEGYEFDNYDVCSNVDKFLVTTPAWMARNGIFTTRLTKAILRELI